MANNTPQILLTNDDGIDSPGLWAAAAVLSSLGYVHVVAPRDQFSGAGRSMPATSDGLIVARQVQVNGRDRRVVTAFPISRSMQAGTASLEGVSAQNLLETSQDSWAETDLALKGRVEFDEGKDRKGPISLGVVGTVRGKAPEPSPSPAAEGTDEKPKAPEGRVVAIGSSDFASNGWLGFYGNQALFLNVVAWLAQDADLISIRPKDQEDQRMFLSAGQKQLVTLVALLLLPGLFVVVGAATWWRRR